MQLYMTNPMPGSEYNPPSINSFQHLAFTAIIHIFSMKQKTKIQLGGGNKMAETIQWSEDMEAALARAQTENLPILLFFHNPG